MTATAHAARRQHPFGEFVFSRTRRRLLDTYFAKLGKNALIATPIVCGLDGCAPPTPHAAETGNKFGAGGMFKSLAPRLFSLLPTDRA